MSIERITLAENDKIINDGSETATIMNTFFSNIETNFNVPEYDDCNDIYGNIADPILKAIFKYRNHFSIKSINRVSNSNDLFSFVTVDKDKIHNKISSLYHKKLHHKKHVRNQTYPQKCLKKMLTFFRSSSSLFSCFSQ